MRGGGDALCWLPNLPFGCTVQNELGLSNPGPIGGRRLSEAVSLTWARTTCQNWGLVARGLTSA